MDSAAAEAHVRLLAERELRRAAAAPRYPWLDEDFKEGGEPPEEEGLLPGQGGAERALKVGVLSEDAARYFSASSPRALAARGLRVAQGPAQRARARPGRTRRRATRVPARAVRGQQAGAAPAGRYRAIPIGLVVPAERTATGAGIPAGHGARARAGPPS